MGEVELKEASGEPFALFSAEFVFAYGIFGFGESFQASETASLLLVFFNLVVLQLHHNFRRAGHFLHHSMFPRIQPPESRADANWCILYNNYCFVQ